MKYRSCSRWYASCCVVLTLLVASLSARGEDVAQPVPANGKCSVKADPQWTSQETFVWRHVCIGEIADFNKAPGYGGNLDPRRPQGLPDSRILKPAFLETILLNHKYRDALTRRGVPIVGARFTDTVDLEGAQLGSDLALYGSLLGKGANLERLRSSHAIVLSGAKVAGTLNMNGLEVDNLNMRDKGEFSEVVLTGAHLGGRLDLSGSKITGTLHMEGLQVDKDLFMVQGESGQVILTGAQVGGRLDLSGSKVVAMSSRRQLGFAGVFVSNASVLVPGDAILLMDAHVGGELRLIGSKVTGTLHMEGLQVDRDLLMKDRAEFGDIVLVGAHVGGQLSLSGSKVTGTLTMDDLQVGSTIFMGRGTEFDGPINLLFGKVGGNLELAGGLFKGTVDLTGTQIGGELRLGSSRNGPARWSPKRALILRDVKADAIQDLSDYSWPDTLDLNGFTYRSLGGLFANSEKDPMISRSGEWFENWLGKQASYTPAPYQQLAAILREQGRSDDADEILYAGKERERAQSSSWRYLWLSANKLFIGYGYHVWWTLRGVAVLLVAGMLFLRFSGEGREHGMPYGFIYSFDMLLPIIRLREKHYKIDLYGWVRYYFYFHKVMGFVLASFLIAGLSGLTLTK